MLSLHRKEGEKRRRREEENEREVKGGAKLRMENSIMTEGTEGN